MSPLPDSTLPGLESPPPDAKAALVIYPGLRHELHNERAEDRAKFFDLIATWILQHAAPIAPRS